MLTLLKTFLPVGRSLWTLGVLGLLCLALGSWLGSRVEQVNTQRVQSQFDQYKIAVLQSENSELETSLAKVAELQGLLGQILRNQRQEAIEDKQTSENLIKELQDANGNSCPLSPAIESYLNGVRKDQQGN